APSLDAVNNTAGDLTVLHRQDYGGAQELLQGSEKSRFPNNIFNFTCAGHNLAYEENRAVLAGIKFFQKRAPCASSRVVVIEQHQWPNALPNVERCQHPHHLCSL